MTKLSNILGGIAILAVGLGLSGPLAASENAKPLTVVELFSSQGCNSCPPANVLVGKLAKRDGILVLSWNVDYWDYLGWKDTLALPGNADRQRAYNKQLGRRGVYTPEIVVQGKFEVRGADRTAVEDRIAQARSNHHLQIGVSEASGKLTLRVAANGGAVPASPCNISLVKYDKMITVPISAGENRGAEVTYTNVVTGVEELGIWQGGVVELEMERGSLSKGGNAILVQEGVGGPLIAAHVIELPR